MTHPSKSEGLRSLLAKVEGASGPSRALDGEVEVAVRWIEAARCGLKPEHRAKWRSNAAGMVGDGFTEYMAEPYTASLDASLALVERVLPGAEYMIGRRYAQIDLADQSPTYWAHTETAPLATCAALLKALIAQEEERS